MKHKTLVESYFDLINIKARQDNTIDLIAYSKGVVDGVKFMKERMYTKQDMIDFGNKMQLVKDISFTGNVSFLFDPDVEILNIKK